MPLAFAVSIRLCKFTLAVAPECGKLLQPLINLIHDTMMEKAVLNVGETRAQVLNERGRSAQQHSFMWVLRSLEQPALLYRYAPSRSGDVAKQLLGD